MLQLALLEDVTSLTPVSESSQLQEKHRLCSTEWVAFRWFHHPTSSHGYVITQNHCGDRACPHCVKFRIAMAKARMSPYFDCIDKPKHVILTTKNLPLNKANLRWFRMKLRSFTRSLERHSWHFFGVYVLEIKPAGNGLYHIHVHIVSNQSLHHQKLTARWSKIVGYHCSTRVKYRAKRSTLLNYFARRCAMAGVGMKETDYLSYVKGSKLFNSFGKFPSYLEVLLTTATEKRKEFTFYMLGTWKKDQNVSVPPDWLDKDLLDQLWLEYC
jgi:hypothetical protein